MLVAGARELPPQLRWRPLSLKLEAMAPLSPVVSPGAWGCHHELDTESPLPVCEVADDGGVGWLRGKVAELSFESNPVRDASTSSSSGVRKLSTDDIVPIVLSTRNLSANPRLCELNDWHQIHASVGARCPLPSHLHAAWYTSIASFEISTRSFDSNICRAISFAWATAAAACAAEASAAVAGSAAAEARAPRSASTGAVCTSGSSRERSRSRSNSLTKRTVSAGPGASSVASTAPPSASSSFSGSAPPAAAIAAPAVPSGGSRSLAWAITEVRVVRGPFVEHAEYLLVAVLNGHLVAAWRRYNDFKALAALARRRRMHKACVAWDILANCQRGHLWRDVSPDFLRYRAHALSDFARNFVFESRTAADVLAIFGGPGVVYL